MSFHTSFLEGTDSDNILQKNSLFGADLDSIKKFKSQVIRENIKLSPVLSESSSHLDLTSPSSSYPEKKQRLDANVLTEQSQITYPTASQMSPSPFPPLTLRVPSKRAYATFSSPDHAKLRRALLGTSSGGSENVSACE